MVLQYIRRHSPDLIMLQETHLKGNTYMAMNRFGYTLRAHAGYTSDSRGTAILIKNSLPFSPHHTWQDPLGRFTALSGTWEGLTLNICSVYIPPKLHHSTLADLGHQLLELPHGILILGGDLNEALFTDMDREKPQLSGAPHMVWDFMQALGLVDLWREHHPTLKQYTHISAAHGSRSRLDYILTHRDTLHLFRESRHAARGISDHSPVETEIMGPERDWTTPPRLDPYLFKDHDFRDKYCDRAKVY